MTLRLWPRRLAGQLMLAAALALVIGQAVNLALIVRGQREQRLEAIAAASATSAASAISVIEAAGDAGEPVANTPDALADMRHRPDHSIRLRIDEKRARQLGILSVRQARSGWRKQRITLGDQPAIGAGFEDWPEMAEKVTAYLDDVVSVQQVRAAIRPVAISTVEGGRYRVNPRRAGQAVAVAFHLQDGRWLTVRTRLAPASSRIGRLLLGQTILLFAILFGPLMVIAWRVSRPLARLADAAGDVRLTTGGAPVAESGPEDVRLLTRAFNSMRERIGHMLAEKDHMLGAIGHDLRTPLSSLRVRAESVADARLREGMIASIEDMAAMLDDILALARAGQVGEAPQSTELAAMLAALVADYQAMGRPVRMADGTPLVPLLRRVHPRSLHRALRNLIDNALTYGETAELSLAIGEDGAVDIMVADEGPGIAPDQIAAMLEPFARAETSRSRNTGGAGLGLALARAAVQAEGGELLLSNRKPRGLLATVHLPAPAETNHT